MKPRLQALHKEFQSLVAASRQNKGLWEALSKAVLLYNDISAQYKESLYRNARIEFRKSDGDNFNPFLRLVCEFPKALTPTDRVTLSQWNLACQRLLAEVKRDEALYRADNAVERLMAYMETHGGVVGLIFGKTDFDENPKRKTSGSHEYDDLRAQVANEVLEKLYGMHPNQVRATGGMFSVLLARAKGPDLEILGTSYDLTLVETLAVATAYKTRGFLPYTLRSLLDVMITQTFPGFALPTNSRGKWFRENYNERSTVKNENGQPTTTSKRLLLKRTNELLLSQARSEVSVVTRCSLKKPLTDTEMTVRLNSNDRVRIEEWIETGEYVHLTAIPDDKLGPAPTPTSVRGLQVINRRTSKEKNLHFHPLNDESSGSFQAEFKRDTFVPDWSFEVAADWTSSIRRRWANNWFEGLGRHNQIKRRHNRRLKVIVSQREFTIIYNMDGTIHPKEVIQLPEGVNGASVETETLYFSKDLGPVLFNLADALIEGPLTIAGNSHALVFRYSTGIGEFEIAVPTLVHDDQRDGSLFYGLGKQP